MKREINKLIPLQGTEVFLDTETNGTNIHTLRPWSVQVTDGLTHSILLTNLSDESVVLWLSEQLKGKTMVAHSAAFDLKVLWKLGIYPGAIHDTLNAEKVLKAGKVFKFGLKDVLKRRGIAELSKEEREVFYDGTFDKRVSLATPSFDVESGIQRVGAYSGHGSPESIWMPEDIDYALSDIEYLPELFRQQRSEAAASNLNRLVALENEYVLSAASIEWNGIHFDTEGAKTFAQELIPPREELREKVNAELAESYRRAAEAEYDRKSVIWEAWDEIWKPIRHKRDQEARKAEVKALKPFKTKPKKPGDFNIASPAQLKLALRGVGVFTDSTAHDTLIELRDEHQVISDLLEWREYEKLLQLLTTVDESVNATTGNIHPGINQNVSSGRQSMYNPNLQQIPSRSRFAKQFRALFTARERNTLVLADYPAFELIYLGTAAKDESLLHALTSERDLHTYTMSRFLEMDSEPINRIRNKEEIELDGQEVLEARILFDSQFNIALLREARDLREWIERLRMIIKTMTYGLSYGLSPFGIARKFATTPEMGEKLTNIFFTTYPNLKIFLDATAKYAKYYFRTPPTRFGRVRHFARIDAPNLDFETRIFRDAGFSYEEAREYGWQEFKIKQREYSQAINRIGRQAGNFMPQGTNADATKLASVYFSRKYRPPQSDVRLVLTVHDELIVESPIDKAEEVSYDLAEAMNKAADWVLDAPGLIKVKPKIAERWEK